MNLEKEINPYQSPIIPDIPSISLKEIASLAIPFLPGGIIFEQYQFNKKNCSKNGYGSLSQMNSYDFPKCISEEILKIISYAYIGTAVYLFLTSSS